MWKHLILCAVVVPVSIVGLTSAQTIRDVPGAGIRLYSNPSNAVVISWPSYPGKYYDVPTTTNLSAPFSVQHKDLIRAETTVTTLTDYPAGNARFYRVREYSAPGSSEVVTEATICEIEKVAGLTFSEAQRSQIVSVLSGGIPIFGNGEALSLRGFASIRSRALRNSDPPALVFDPRPSGFVMNQNQQPVVWGPSPTVTLPENREQLAFYSVRELAELIRTRQLTSLELTQLYIDRLKRYGSTLSAVVTLTEALALQQAQRADNEIAAGNYRGFLHGIPYGLKDLFAVRNYPTTWGAAPFRDQVLDEDATIVRKLEQAGAVLVAKLAMGALAYNDSWYGGQTRNPWNLAESSGGSSSGPAAATSAGLVAFAMGTESIGSLLAPAQQCRVTALRPTFGAVSRAGAMALSWSMDKAGPMCRTVEDAAIVFDAIRGVDSADKTTVNTAFNFRADRGVFGRKVGYFPERTSPAVLSTLASLVGQSNLVQIAFPDFPAAAMLTLMYVEAAAAFDELTRSGGLDFLPSDGTHDLPNLLRTARTVPAVDYLQADRLRKQLIEETAALFQQIDLYVSPLNFDHNLTEANLIGLPCVGVPTGGGESLLFVGNWHSEATLLELVSAYHAAIDYTPERPPLFVD